MNKIIFAVVGATLIVISGYFLIGGKNSDQPITTDEPSPVISAINNIEESVIPSVSVEAQDANQPSVREFVVSGDDFSFDIKEIKVKQGDKVKIVFKNKIGFHDWKIDEFNAATKKIQAGQEDVVEFVADKKGIFEYYCSVGSHRAKGMKGNLVVE